jgi:hypothetical protein
MARRIITSIKYSRKIILYNYIEETHFKSLSNSLNVEDIHIEICYSLLRVLLLMIQGPSHTSVKIT